MLPKPIDLTAVRSGPGFIVGQLADKHPQFDYLRSNTFCGFFDSVPHVFAAIRSLSLKPRNGRSSDSSGSGEFNAFDSLAEAIDVFTNKPRTIREFAADDRMLTSVEGIGNDVYFDVSGAFLDVSRFLEGSPECFGNMTQGNPHALQVTLMFNANAVCHVSSAALQHKQKEMLRLVDWFESRGVRCQVIGYASTQCAHLQFTVKRFEDAANLNDIAIVGHTDFLRRIVFLFDEQSPTWESGYGSPRNFTSIMTRSYEPDPHDGLTIYVDDQSTSDFEEITRSFDNCKRKVADVISSPEKRDFSKVYMVQL